MATSEQTSASTASSGALSRAVAEVRESVLVKIALFGLFEIALAAGLELAIQAGVFSRAYLGIWAAVLTVWGVGLFLVGSVGRALIWWNRR